MQIIHNTKAVFDVTINPFLKIITIEHLPTSMVEAWSYDELDEWKSISFDVEYDFHFLYDENMEFYIYKIGEYENCIPLNLHIEF